MCKDKKHFTFKKETCTNQGHKTCHKTATIMYAAATITYDAVTIMQGAATITYDTDAGEEQGKQE